MECLNNGDVFYMKKNYFKLIAILFIANLSGCSLFNLSSETISASCSEADATLLIRGVKFEGQGQIVVEKDESFFISCAKPGYITSNYEVNSSISTTGALDLAGAVIFLVPAIGFFSPGAFDHDQTNFHLPMVKE